MLDILIHLIPGVDDGAEDEQMALLNLLGFTLMQVREKLSKE